MQKMICEAMGTAEDLVVAGVNSQFGQQVIYFHIFQGRFNIWSFISRKCKYMIKCFKGGQIAQTAQSGFNQFQSNPNQFVQASNEYFEYLHDSYLNSLY